MHSPPLINRNSSHKEIAYETHQLELADHIGCQMTLLLVAAGFKLTRIVPTPSSMNVIEAERL